MQVRKEMLNKELQSSYWMLKLSAKVLMNKTGVRLLNSNSSRSKGKNIEGLQGEERFVPSRNGGPDIRIRIFKPSNFSGQLPGMLYIHGGGMLMGNPEDYLAIIKKFIDAKPCVIVAPDYRKALDAPYPAAFNDCYDTLLWMDENADLLDILQDKLIIAGHSAGGGLAAAVSLKATDTQDVNIAFQMPIYPMLDDRQVTESARDNDAPGWSSKSNNLGWTSYLSDLIKRGAPIPAYAAPARAKDYSKIPPTITFVGDLEPFRDETIQYVENLKQAGIPVTFKLYEGCFHAFDVVFPDLEISKDAWAYLLTSYKAYVDAYIYSK
jgi:acetyl esterase/lipase